MPALTAIVIGLVAGLFTATVLSLYKLVLKQIKEEVD